MFAYFFIVFLLFFNASANSTELNQNEGMCAPEIERESECLDPSIRSGNDPAPSDRIDAGKARADKASNNHSAAKTNPDAQSPEKHPARLTIDPGAIRTEPADPAANEFTVHFFWGSGCPHCKEEKVFLDEMKTGFPRMKVIDYEVWHDKDNAAYFSKMAEAYKIKTGGVPITFIGDKSVIGFSDHSKKELAALFQECSLTQCVDPADLVSGKTPLPAAIPGSEEQAGDLECTEKSKAIYIPWIGNLDSSQISLPVITLVIAGLDSFNPCAFFVLFSLLGLLIHARSREKMFMIGSVFIFFSGFIYFLFMSAWLNLFLVMGRVDIITKLAGVLAVAIALINIKDFFAFKKGVSLTIPDSAKPKLFDRMRKLLKADSVAPILIGTAVLAIAANSYELLCTAGFPMVYTRILTLNELSSTWYYVYLILYNVIYIIPLSIIVIVFTVTLGKKHLTERQGRIMKLFSGTMMLALGGVLLINPAALSNVFISFVLLAGSICVSIAVAVTADRLKVFK